MRGGALATETPLRTCLRVFRLTVESQDRLLCIGKLINSRRLTDHATRHEIAAGSFAVIQPYTNRQDRLHGFGLAGDAIEMLVVDAHRRPVVRGH